MSTSPSVYTGVWTDYNRPWGEYKLKSNVIDALLMGPLILVGWQRLSTDPVAQFWKTFVAVLLGLSGAYIFAIHKSLLSRFILWFEGDSPERQPLLVHGQEETIRTLVGSPLSNREKTWKLFKYYVESHNKSGSTQFLVWICIAFTFALWIGWLFMGIFSAKVATDRAALSSSTHCGIWTLDENAGDEDAARADLSDYQKEGRAGEYARHCYGSSITVDWNRCDFFYRQDIPFTNKSGHPCPFSPSLCLYGLYSAVSFDTGLVDASSIGVNYKTTHKFRRNTTCSPLNMDYPYVRNETSLDSNETTYYYYYGSIFDDTSLPSMTRNYTYKTSGNPFNWLAPVYSVNVYSTSLYPEEDYWRPILGLRPPENHTLTIMFVSSMHIYYLEAGYDPIFPATGRYDVEGFRRPYWYNSDPRARALACVDYTELCSPDGKTCWPMTADLPDNVPNTPAYWLMKWSLETSTIYDSIKWRLGAALLAQEEVSQFRSPKLEADHWEKEVEQLFATSLARIQFSTMGIATGEDRDARAFTEVTPAEARGKLCGMYKFHSIGYTNINLWRSIIFLSIPCLVLFLSLEWRTVKNFFCFCCRREGSQDEGEAGRTSSEPLVMWQILKLPKLIFLGVKFLFRHMKNLVRRIGQ